MEYPRQPTVEVRILSRHRHSKCRLIILISTDRTSKRLMKASVGSTKASIVVLVVLLVSVDGMNIRENVEFRYIPCEHYRI